MMYGYSATWQIEGRAGIEAKERNRKKDKKDRKDKKAWLGLYTCCFSSLLRDTKEQERIKNTKKGGKPPTAVSANAHCPDLACMLWFWSVVCVSLSVVASVPLALV